MAMAKPVHHHDTRRVGRFAAKSLDGGGSEYRERSDSIVSLPGAERVRESAEPVSLYEHPSNCMMSLFENVQAVGWGPTRPGGRYIGVVVLRTGSNEGTMPLRILGAIAMVSRWGCWSRRMLVAKALRGTKESKSVDRGGEKRGMRTSFSEWHVHGS